MTFYETVGWKGVLELEQIPSRPGSFPSRPGEVFPVYRLLKAYTPGPYTFVLKATREVPRRLMHPKRKTIGRLFIDVFQKHADTIDDAEFLAQGTLYPDVI